MADDVNRLHAALAARLQQLGLAPNDPRLGPAIAHVQALMRRAGTPGADDNAILRPSFSAPNSACDSAPLPLPGGDLPDRLKALLEACVDAVHVASRRPAGDRLRVYALTLEAPALSASEEGRSLLNLSAEDRTRVAVHAYSAWVAAQFGGVDRFPLQRIASDLLRAKLEIDETQAILLVKSAIRDGFSETSYTPNLVVSRALQRHVEQHGLKPALRDTLSGLRTRMALKHADAGAEGRKLLSIVDAMLAFDGCAPGSEPRFKPKPDAWGQAIESKLATLPFEQCARLTCLLHLAARGGETAKPAKGWLKKALQELENLDRECFGTLLLEVIECHEPGTQISLENQSTLRALLWLAALAAPQSAGRRLEAYAQKCLTFSSVHFAYMSLVLGNATVHAFSLMPGTGGVGSLSRLKRRLKRPGEIKMVEKALAALAAARGMTSGELEEIGLPDYGFDGDGRLEIAVGPATAVLKISPGSELSTVWCSAYGKPLSGPPAAVKQSHADALKSLKAQAKEIGETLKTQRLRLERLYLSDCSWPFDVWRARYLSEPLVAGLARRLIWSFDLGGHWVAGLAQTDGVFDSAGARLPLDDGTVHVRLWHPMQAQVAHVLAWRQRLAKLGLTQPFKQAHREIYVLTDAERETGVYSNRFAGHIVTQHLFRALALARGWKCPALGGWDSGGGRPLKQLPEHKLQVEFWVDPVESSLAEGYQFQYLSTDQVRFVTAAGEPVPLVDMDAVLFSELMRDVDLFVGVSSIVSDPNWADREADHFGEYWSRAAFGTLTEVGKARHAVLADILPGLTIAPHCRLEDRNLVVEGKLRTYRIHLGSGNIQMAPTNQYLCIVQDRQNSFGNVRLPFEGDATLSLILSKAFMLTEDDKIKDKSILTQITRATPHRDIP